MMKLDERRFSQSDFQIGNLNSPGEQHNFKTSLAVTMPLYDPALAPARDIAARESEVEDTRLNGAREETAFRTFRLYLAVQKAEARIRAAEQAVSEAGENLRLARVRSQAGVGLRSEELRTRTNLAMSEQRLSSARNNRAIARLELASVLGLKETDTIEIAEPGIKAVALPEKPAELIAAALKNRNELKILLAEQEKADAAVRLAASGYLPAVNAFASYQLNSASTPLGADGNAWGAGVALTWPLFEGFRSDHQRDRAVAGRSAAAEQLEHARREASLRVQESCLRSEEMGLRLQVSRNSLQDAEETVRLLSRRFENSLATLVELLDAQTVLNQTRAELVDSEADYALANGYVYFSAGMFLKEMNK